MKKWIKRIALGLGTLFLLLLIGFYVEREIAINAGKAKLKEVRAKLDAAEPGWRLDELIARRNASLPPDDRNVAVLALNVMKQIPDEFLKWERKSKKKLRSHSQPNRLVDAEGIADLRKQFEPIIPLIKQLHEIRKYPNGGFKMTLIEPFDDFEKHSQTQKKIREASRILSWQVILSTQDNDPVAAIEACRTAIHLRHAIGDDPITIVQLIRLLLITIAINSTERTLGMTEPKEGLAELQADFEKSLMEADSIRCIESERALNDLTFENYENGLLSISKGGSTTGSWDFSEWLGDLSMRRQMYINHVQMLEQLTAIRSSLVKHRKERVDAIKVISNQKQKGIASSLVGLNAAVIESLLVSQIGTDAKLATIITAIACERYRQANGDWPESLDKIPKEILKVIPLDPFVDGPVQFKRNEMGVVIYSTGKDETDDGGVKLDEAGEKTKTDIGIQLYDQANRRLPAKVNPDDAIEGPPPLPE